MGWITASKLQLYVFPWAAPSVVQIQYTLDIHATTITCYSSTIYYQANKQLVALIAMYRPTFPIQFGEGDGSEWEYSGRPFVMLSA